MIVKTYLANYTVSQTNYVHHARSVSGISIPGMTQFIWILQYTNNSGMQADSDGSRSGQCSIYYALTLPEAHALKLVTYVYHKQYFMSKSTQTISGKLSGIYTHLYIYYIWNNWNVHMIPFHIMILILCDCSHDTLYLIYGVLDSKWA